MNVLVAVASKHGSTEGIADAIAAELQAMGIVADVWNVGEDPPLDRYDAVVLGSAVYMGSWLGEARQFAERHRAELSKRPVWLFSSGPLGAPDPQPHDDPARLAAPMGEVDVRDHRVFVGKLDPSQLGFGERLAAKLVRAPQGDFRDWENIRGWAREIGTVLSASRVAAGPSPDVAASRPREEETR